jgi:flagellar basal body-associated protein FliL
MVLAFLCQGCIPATLCPECAFAINNELAGLPAKMYLKEYPMKRSRWIPIAALVLFALLLGGCINIQQEYWLYEDGSAKVGMDIGMSQALLSMGATSGSDTTTSPFDDLKQQFNDTNPNFKNVQTREYADKDLQHFAVTFEVANFEDFLKTEAAQSSQDSEFNITLTHTPDDNILFKQVTQLDTGGQTSGMDLGSMDTVFKDMYWTVIVHVPRVVSTNGERVDNNTVQWKIPMADIFAGKAPGELTLVYTPRGAIGGAGSRSLVVGLIVGIVLLAVAGGAAYYFLVFRKRQAPAPAAGGFPSQWSVQPPQPGAPPQWNAQPQQPGAPPQWNVQPPQPGVPAQWNAQPPQWGAQPQPGAPAQWNAQPPGPEVPPQWGAQPQPGSAPQWDGQAQPGTPGTTPPTPPQQPPPQQPPAHYDQAPPQQPDYPAYPQYTQGPQYPPGPVQGSDYYPTYPPQQPPAAPPPMEPPPDQPDQR